MTRFSFRLFQGVKKGKKKGVCVWVWNRTWHLILRGRNVGYPFFFSSCYFLIVSCLSVGWHWGERKK